MISQEHKKQYYPAFLKEFKGAAFDASKLGAAFLLWKQKNYSPTPEAAQALFSEFKIDEAHWNFHQRILHDEVLFRLIAEGYIHPKSHPVPGIYDDKQYYEFVFPFIHTAVMKRMAVSIENGNMEALKLLEQWIEPFGTLFKESMFGMVEYFTRRLQKQLAEFKLQGKTLPLTIYNQISPTLMHMLNRLDDRGQQLRNQFAIQLMETAVWLRNDMRVHTQPSGLMSRIKLLNVAPDIHAERSMIVAEWDKQLEEADRISKFPVTHLLWIIPAVSIAAFFIWRQTDMGKSVEDRMEDRAEDLMVEQAKVDSVQREIAATMNSIDLNELVVNELVRVADVAYPGNSPDALSGTAHLDNGDLVYNDWLRQGRTVYFADQAALFLDNQSSCDVIAFVRQMKAPYMERAYYVRAGRNVLVMDNEKKDFQLRFYAGSAWIDSLVTARFDVLQNENGVPPEVQSSLPDPPDLRGCFQFPARNVQDLAMRVSSKGITAGWDPNGVPIVVIKGDLNGITTK